MRKSDTHSGKKERDTRNRKEEKKKKKTLPQILAHGFAAKLFRLLVLLQV